MRYSAVLLAGFAGLASQAMAQNFSLTIVSSATSVSAGGSFTATIYGDADVGSHILGGAFGIEANSAFVENMAWQNAAWSAFNNDGGFAGNGNYNQVVFGQLVIPGIFPPAAGSELGSAIGTFTITMSASYANQVIEFDLIGGSPFSLESVDSDTGETFQSSNGSLSLGSFQIGIPSPSGIAVFGAAGLFASRRRR